MSKQRSTMASYQSNNLYGYKDYNGPRSISNTNRNNDDDSSAAAINPPEIKENDRHVDVEEENPLTCGFWMEGDSLAPPCGTSISTIHELLDFAGVSDQDVLYDLGCGDGRVCLEAITRCACRNAVGVEIESDLIAKFQSLIERLPDNSLGGRVLPLQQDLRTVVQTLIQQSKDKTQRHEPLNDNPIPTRLPNPTVIVMYLLPEALEELQGPLIQLMDLLPNLRLVCNTWGLDDSILRPAKTQEVEEEGGASTMLYLYTNEERGETGS